MILRLRGIFIIRCLINNKKFSNKHFKEWLIGKGIKNQEFGQVYNIYRLIKNNQSINTNIKIAVAEKLLNLLQNETNLIGSKL